MKKILLFAFIACSAVLAQAQITLDSNAIGPIGSTFVQTVDTILAPGYNIGSPGTNLTWDFSQLNQDYYDTTMYVDPSTTPSAADFPTANLAIEQSSQAGGHAYFTKTDTEFRLLGFAGDPLQLGTPIVAQNTPPSLSATFPWTYMSTLHDSSSYTVTIDGSFLGFPGVDSARMFSTAVRDVVCDSWGNLILWGGSYNALRNKEITTTHDVISIRFFGSWTVFQDTIYTDSSFIWLNNTKGFTLAQANYEGGRLVSIATLDGNPVSVSPVIDGRTTVYPNPADHYVVVRNEDGDFASIRLLNLQGQEVRFAAVNGYETIINTEGLAAGIYLLSAEDENHHAVVRRKVVIR